MAAGWNIGSAALERLAKEPGAVVEGRVGDRRWSLRLAIPNYASEIARHYHENLANVPVAFDYTHFGVEFDFESPAELTLYDDEHVLDEDLRALVSRFGPVFFTNAYLTADQRQAKQRNIFPDLSFHYDRSPAQGNVYSLFWRDPFDPVQRLPRRSSTVFVANIVAYLQSLREGQAAHELRALYRLFENENIEELSGKVLIERCWTAPEGTGEIAVFDNRTILHASYYRRKNDRGYPIGVRYLY